LAQPPLRAVAIYPLLTLIPYELINHIGTPFVSAYGRLPPR
jgi:hypothetical protein